MIVNSSSSSSAWAKFFTFCGLLFLAFSNLSVKLPNEYWRFCCLSLKRFSLKLGEGYSCLMASDSGHIFPKCFVGSEISPYDSSEFKYAFELKRSESSLAPNPKVSCRPYFLGCFSFRVYDLMKLLSRLFLGAECCLNGE